MSRISPYASGAGSTRISPCLWFDREAEEAAESYTRIFPNSRILGITRYGKAGFEIHQQPAGSVMTVDFELEGLAFTGLNGGPVFRFNEAVSFQVRCVDQQEVDYFWTELGAGGDPKAQQCGWLKDRFGLSWQIVPDELVSMLKDPDPLRYERTMQAMLQMKKIDVNRLRVAYRGGNLG